MKSSFYFTVTNAACKSKNGAVLTKAAGYIESPKLPCSTFYPGNEACTWMIILSDQTKVIQHAFHEISTDRHNSSD